jgi:hypothetical protein
MLNWAIITILMVVRYQVFGFRKQGAGGAEGAGRRENK